MATDFVVTVAQPIGIGSAPALTTELVVGALTTLVTAKTFLKRDDTTDDDVKIALCVNHATGAIERWCRRKLKSTTATYYVDGTGERSVALPEWPMTSLSSASLVSSGGGEDTEIDISSVIPHEGGVVALRGDVFPAGSRNICISAVCGYKAGVHDSELAALELACLALTQVYFVKMNNQAYGVAAIGLSGNSADIPSEPMPLEVIEIIKNFQRIC
jgi:hypothetical protein